MQNQDTTDKTKSDLQNETNKEKIEKLNTYIKLYQNPPTENNPFESARYPFVIPGTEPYVLSPWGNGLPPDSPREANTFNQARTNTANETKTDAQKDDKGLIVRIKKFLGPPIKRAQTVSTSSQSIFNKHDKNNNDHSEDTTNERHNFKSKNYK